MRRIITHSRFVGPSTMAKAPPFIEIMTVGHLLGVLNTDIVCLEMVGNLVVKALPCRF
jgi:hypothetical protein